MSMDSACEVMSVLKLRVAQTYFDCAGSGMDDKDWSPPAGKWLASPDESGSKQDELVEGDGATREASVGKPEGGVGQRPCTPHRERPPSAPRSSTSDGTLQRHRPAPLMPGRPLLQTRARLPIVANGSVSGKGSLSNMVLPTGAYSSSSKAPAPKLASPSRAGQSLARETQTPAVTGEQSDDRVAIRSLTARLHKVERLNHLQAAKMAKQSQELDQLRAELRLLRAQEDTVVTGSGDVTAKGCRDSHVNALMMQLEQVKTERDHFQQQAAAMSQFLEDYGLKWVGDASSPSDSDAKSEASASDTTATAPVGGSERDGGEALAGATSPSCPSPSSKPTRHQTSSSWHVDISALKSCVDGLNATVEKAGAQVVSARVGGVVHARLVADDAPPLPLTFFRDGVKLGERGFQDCRTAEAQHLLRDIQDGYFPYVLKDKYPDGVLLKLVDRLAHKFDEWLSGHASADPDLIDGGDRLLPAMGRAIRARAEKLPEKVVKGGRVCAGTAGQRGNSAPAEDRSAMSSISRLEADRDPTAPTVRLQVKFENGQRLVLCLEPHSTIGALEDALVCWAGGGEAMARKPISLHSAFPRRGFPDRSQTLESAGLAPSATLFATSTVTEG